MHLLYLDDSGSVGDASQQHFVLAGISVFERQGHWISEGLDRVAARFNPAEPRAVELHGSPMLKGSRGWRRHPVADRVDIFSHRFDTVGGIVHGLKVVSPEAGIVPC